MGRRGRGECKDSVTIMTLSMTMSMTRISRTSSSFSSASIASFVRRSQSRGMCEETFVRKQPAASLLVPWVRMELVSSMRVSVFTTNTPID